MHEDDLQILLGNLDDLRESITVPSHTATASRRTRSLIRTFRPPVFDHVPVGCRAAAPVDLAHRV